MKCKYCGEEFEQAKRGRKKEYCNKEECIRQARNEANRKWYSNKLKALEGTKIKIVGQDDKRVIYSSTDRAINAVKNEDFSDVIGLARKLGAIRFEIVEAIQKCSPEQSLADKQDSIFLHEIENLIKKDTVSTEDIVQIVEPYLNKRANRRFIKDKQEMLKHLIQGCISNPNQYVIEYIKNRDNRTYNPNKEEKVGTNERINKKVQ